MLSLRVIRPTAASASRTCRIRPDASLRKHRGRCFASSTSKTKKQPKPKRSLALSVHFLHPEFGMRKHEILSRATAFLLAVDPPNSASSTNTGDSVESFLEKREEERSLFRLKQHYSYEPAGGPARPPRELGWLEFCPGNFRPAVHVVAASHVLCPWMWPGYYQQEWLKRVQLEHCAYTLEVYDADEGGEEDGADGTEGGSKEALAKFALNPYPIHHPAGMDLALMHIKGEDTALKHMRDLGVEALRLRPDDMHFSRGERVTFDGFRVAEDNAVDGAAAPEKASEGKSEEEDDERTFFHFTEPGELVFSSPQRILASTSRPLPEGLCGGPALDADGNVAGVVEGIVPLNHDDVRLRGAAAFLPCQAVRDFVEWAEREMLGRIVPRKVFERVVELKSGKKLFEDRGKNEFDGNEVDEEYRAAKKEAAAKADAEADDGDRVGGPHSGDLEGKEYWEAEGKKVERAYESMVTSLKETHSSREAEAVLATIERERQEVIDTLTREGGDLDEIVARVRRRTRERQMEIVEEARKRRQEEAKEELEEGEIVSENETGKEKSS